MKRTIIKIDEKKCNGCGLCVTACHEGAIGLVDGKAKLLRDDYCDGMGDCLPECPAGAISFEEREAAVYDEMAVAAARLAATTKACIDTRFLHGGCPSSQAKIVEHAPSANGVSAFEKNEATGPITSELHQWPVQIKLASPMSSYFDGASILIAADCTAYSYGDFHRDFMRGRVTLIGCPKLDAVDYSEKLTAIFTNHDVRDITVVRMEVPCCGDLEMAVRYAVWQSGKDIPLNVVIITTEGDILP